MFAEADLQRLTDIDSFAELSSADFEYCCKYLLEKAGYGKVFVTRKGPKGGDGGIDLDVYSKQGVLIACGQCKCWKERFNGFMSPIRELYGSMKIRGANRGIFLTTCDATFGEKEVAERLNIEMIDGPELMRLIRRCAMPVQESEKIPADFNRPVKVHALPQVSDVTVIIGPHREPSENWVLKAMSMFIGIFVVIALLVFLVKSGLWVWVLAPFVILFPAPTRFRSYAGRRYRSWRPYFHRSRSYNYWPRRHHWHRRYKGNYGWGI